MRMGFLFSGIFWGILVVLVGLSILANAAFGWKIPVFSVVFGLFFVFLGISLLFGPRSWHGKGKSVMFDERDVEVVRSPDKHDVIFGKANIDLTRVALGDSVFAVEISTVFGSSEVRIDPAMPVKVVASSVFGSVSLPDGNSITFGDHTWKSDSLGAGKGYLLVKVDCVFGSVEFKNR